MSSYWFLVILTFILVKTSKPAGECRNSADFGTNRPNLAISMWELFENSDPRFLDRKDEALEFSDTFCVYTPDGKPLTVTYAFQCSPVGAENKYPCSPPVVPFFVNDAPIGKFETCSTTFHSIDNETALMSCTLTYTQSIILAYDWFTRPGLPVGAALVVTAGWLLEPGASYQVLPYNDASILIPESDKPLWLTIVLDNGLDVLKRFGSDDPQEGCIYELHADTWNDARQENDLLNIDETEPFTQQYLENSRYSARIPVGCSPVIEIGKRDDLYNETQVLCDGTALVTTQGYHSRDQRLDDDYYLWRRISCDHIVDITVEVRFVFDGVLEIEFIDLNHEVVRKEEFEAPFENPQNYTVLGIRSVTLYWPRKSIVVRDGAFALVHMKSSDQSDPPEVITTTTTDPPLTRMATTRRALGTTTENLAFYSRPLNSVLILLLLSLSTGQI